MYIYIYQLCIIQLDLLPLSMLEAHRTYQSSLGFRKLRYPLITQLSDAKNQSSSLGQAPHLEELPIFTWEPLQKQDFVHWSILKIQKIHPYLSNGHINIIQLKQKNFHCPLPVFASGVLGLSVPSLCCWAFFETWKDQIYQSWTQ